jgi:hypothetical protein
MGFKRIGNLKVWGFVLAATFLTACGGRGSFTGPYHISEYITENNTNYTLEIIHSAGCFQGEFTAHPGERVVPYRQSTEPGTFQEAPARARIQPDYSEFEGVAAFARNDPGERELVGLWTKPFGPRFSYEGEQVVDGDTYYKYVMSVEDSDLDFNLRLPFNYYWLLNNSGKDLSVTTTMNEPFAEVPDYSVADLLVPSGEKVLLAKLNHSIYTMDCPEFESRESYYVFDSIAVSVKDSGDSTPVIGIKRFNTYFTSEDIIDPASHIVDFHHTMTVTESMISQ